MADTVSKYEEEKERLFMRYEQHRKQITSLFIYYHHNFCHKLTFIFHTGKKEKNMIAEHEKACATKVSELEESLKKKKKVTFLPSPPYPPTPPHPHPGSNIKALLIHFIGWQNIQHSKENSRLVSWQCLWWRLSSWWLAESGNMMLQMLLIFLLHPHKLVSFPLW